MAKKKRNNRKKHNRNQDAQNQDEFLADVPETNPEEYDQGWDQDKSEPMELRDNNNENDSIVDPYSEQLNDHSNHEEEKVVASEETSEPIYEEEDEYQEEIYQEEGHQTEDQQVAGFSLGAYLQGEREKLGISLKNVSQSTKISITKLEHLEADAIDSLPDRAYVTGYVKSYAKLLGVELNFCLNLLDKTYEAKGATPREPEIVIPQAQNSPTISDGFPMAKIAAIAAMVIIIVGIGGFFLTRDKNPQTETTETSEPTPSQAEKMAQEEGEGDSDEITPQTLNAETPLQQELSEQTEEPASNDQEAVSDSSDQAPPKAPKEEIKAAETKEEVKVAEVKKEEPKEEEKKEEESEDKEKRKFYPLAKNLYSFDTEMSEERINELLPSQFRVSPVDGIQAVFITATKGDSWLTYKSDDDPIKKFVLKEGRSLLFRAKEARVFLGNLGAVRIFLNNRPLKVSSRTGVKSLVFPQENAGDYVMPLFIYKEDGSVQTSEDWIKENE